MSNLNSPCNLPEIKTDDSRIALLRQVKEKLAHYSDMLDFFEPIFEERKQYVKAITTCPDLCIEDDPVYQMRHYEGFPILTKDDIPADNPIITNYFLKLAKIIKAQASPQSDMLDAIIQKKRDFCFESLIGHDFHKAPSIPDNAIIEFLIDETLGPVLEIYSEKLKHCMNAHVWSEGFCPVCGKQPAFGLLNADDGKRTLICATCSFEWEFKRIKCAFCGNEDQRLLSYLMVEHEDMYRIETCDACRCYLKTIDLQNATHEIECDVESIITLHLDIVASNHGYCNAFRKPSAEILTQTN